MFVLIISFFLSLLFTGMHARRTFLFHLSPCQILSDDLLLDSISQHISEFDHQIPRHKRAVGDTSERFIASLLLLTIISRKYPFIDCTGRRSRNGGQDLPIDLAAAVLFFLC